MTTRQMCSLLPAVIALIFCADLRSAHANIDRPYRDVMASIQAQFGCASWKESDSERQGAVACAVGDDPVEISLSRDIEGKIDLVEIIFPVEGYSMGGRVEAQARRRVLAVMRYFFPTWQGEAWLAVALDGVREDGVRFEKEIDNFALIVQSARFESRLEGNYASIVLVGKHFVAPVTGASKGTVTDFYWRRYGEVFQTQSYIYPPLCMRAISADLDPVCEAGRQ